MEWAQLLQAVLLPLLLFYLGTIEKRLLMIRDKLENKADKPELREYVELCKQTHDVQIEDLKEDIQELKQVIKELNTKLQKLV